MSNTQKSNKGLVGLFIVLLVVAIILALMLVMCGRGGNDPATDPTQTSIEETQETTEAPTEEPAVPETTEEPTEEPTEETTEETTGGNSRPGGSGGGSSGGSGSGTKPTDPTDTTEPTETEPPVEVSDPGTETNAYTERVSQFPGEFTTVVIPAKGQMHYHVYTTGVTMVIEDAESAVVYGGKTYKPEDGVITIPLSGSDAEPAVLRIDNKGKSGKALKIQVKEAPGAQSNPIVLESIEQFKASLPADDKDGMYYSWTADANGTIRLSVDSITPAGVGAEMVVKVGKQTYKLSEAEDGVMLFNVEEGDEVLIQIVVQPDAQGTHPAAEVAVKGETVLPIDLYVMNVPGSETTDVIPGGFALYYNLYGVSQTIMTIEDKDVWVIYDGQTYTPDENGVITVNIAPGNPRNPAAVQIGNSGKTGKPVQMNFVYPVGAYGNPEVLTALGDLETNVIADTNGYYYTYTAESDGLLTFRVWGKPEGETLKTDIILTNLTTSVQSSIWTYDEENQTDVENPNVEVLVAKGDEIMILVSVMDTETYATVDAQVSSEGFMQGSGAGSAITVIDDGSDDSDRTVTMTTVETPADMELYYAVPKITDGILTVTGQGNFSVVYDETEYTSVDGELVIPNVSAVSTNEPAILTLKGDTACAYDFLITFPEGHQMNPTDLKLDDLEGNTATVEAGDEDGYFFRWIATEGGELQIVMQDPADASWQAYIYNKTTGKQLDVVTTKDVKEETATRRLVMEVAKDDEIEVCVSTYNEENPNRYVAGSVIFSAYLHGTEKDPILLTRGEDGNAAYDTLKYTTGVPFYFAIPEAENVTLTVANVERGRFSVGYGETVINSSSARAGTKITVEGMTAGDENKTQVFYVEGKTDNSFHIEVTYPAVALRLENLMVETDPTLPTEEVILPPEEEETTSATEETNPEETELETEPTEDAATE